MFHELHKDKPWHDGTYTIRMAEFSLLTPFHYTDGVSIGLGVDDFDPDDKFTTDPSAKPWTLRRSVTDTAERR